MKSNPYMWLRGAEGFAAGILRSIRRIAPDLRPPGTARIVGLCYGILFLALISLGWLAIKPWVIAHGWRTLADDLRLNYTAAKGFLGTPSPGYVKGNYRGHPVELSLFIEHVPSSDVDTRYRYLRITIGLRKNLNRQLVMVKRWRMQRTRWGEGVPLPDRKFSDRYSIMLSDPPDFAMKVFNKEALRNGIHAAMGLRRSFYLNLEGGKLYFSTQATDWFLPNGGIEWRAATLKKLIEVLVDIAEAAEAAPTARWSLRHLQDEQESRQHSVLGSPVAAYTIRRQGTNLAGAVILGLATVLLLLSIPVMSTRSLSTGLICLGMSLPLVLLGILASVKGMERIMLFDHGLTHRLGRRIEMYAWNDIKHVWTRWRRRGLNPQYILERKDGQRLRLSKKVPNDDQLMRYVTQGTYEAQKQALLAANRSGRTIHFGPVSIMDDDLRLGERSFPIEGIETLSVSYSGDLAVHVRGEAQPPTGVNADQVPDLHILNGLITELQGDESAIRAFPGEVESADLSVTYVGDPRYETILNRLADWTHDREPGFIVFTEPATGSFVQFLKLGAEVLMLDLPLASMDAETFRRAAVLFRGVSAARRGPPTRDGSFQVDFNTDAAGLKQASSLATAVLDRVFDLPAECALSVHSGR